MQQPWQQQAPPQAQPPVPQEATKSFGKALFDFKFESYVAPRLLGVLYGVFLLGLVLLLLFGVGSGLWGIIDAIGDSGNRYSSTGSRIMTHLGQIVATPIAAAVYLLMGRMYFELMSVMFRGVALLESIDKKTR